MRRVRVPLPYVGKAADRAWSRSTKDAGPRTAGLKATQSVCPYCAVGCGQVAYTRDGELVGVEGDPTSPINQGTLCPKGSATRQLVQQPGRLTRVQYRAPHATEWQELELEQAMDMIAERALGFAHLGGATLDNEENYLIKKSFTAMGAVQIENQARI
jgi:formate dehydrogenase major subunit